MSGKTCFEYRKIDTFFNEKSRRQGRFQDLLAPDRVHLDSSLQHCEKLMKAPQKDHFCIKVVQMYYNSKLVTCGGSLGQEKVPENS